jgi:hypothetical protein
MPDDDQLMGAGTFVLDDLIRDSTYLREKMAFWIGSRLGQPVINQRYIHVYFNATHKGVIYTDSQHPNKDFLKSWYPDMSDGDLFEIKDWFEGVDPNGSSQITDGDLENYTTTGGVKKQARYRVTWDKKPRHGADDDYSSLFALVDAMNAMENYGDVVDLTADVDEWMRSMAFRHAIDDWDGYGFNRGKNCYCYKPDLGLWKVINWDLDMALGASSSGDANLFSTTDPALSGKFFVYDPFLRYYWRLIYDAVNGPFLSTNFDPQIDKLYTGLTNSGIAVAAPLSIKQWVATRRAFLLGKLNAVTAGFALITHAGTNFVSATNIVVIEGSAPVTVESIRVNGLAYPVTWLSRRATIRLSSRALIRRTSPSMA